MMTSYIILQELDLFHALTSPSCLNKSKRQNKKKQKMFPVLTHKLYTEANHEFQELINYQVSPRPLSPKNFL